MKDSPGGCVEQYNVECGKTWWYIGVTAAVAASLLVHGSWPYGPVHLIGIVAGVVMVLFQLVQVLPGSCCLQVCENGLVVRTWFFPAFLGWSSISGFSVTQQSGGPRVTVSIDPALGFGRQLHLGFTYRFSPETLAEKLTTHQARYRDEATAQLERGC